MDYVCLSDCLKSRYWFGQTRLNEGMNRAEGSNGDEQASHTARMLAISPYEVSKGDCLPSECVRDRGPETPLGDRPTTAITHSPAGKTLFNQAFLGENNGAWERKIDDNVRLCSGSKPFSP